MQSKRPAYLERKYSVDSFKNLSSKPEASGKTRDKLPVFGIQKNGRPEGSVQDLSNVSELPEKSNRRAEIVAAVTKRLYSHGRKNSEDNKIITIPVLPEESATENLPVQSPVLEIPAMTKIRLQEISRKMLAKRRRIIVDTQTDFYESTTRVKDVYTLTDKIKHRDAGVLTDEHENLPSFANGTVQVRRVKEKATNTDKLPTTIIRFKDATCLTEDAPVNPEETTFKGNVVNEEENVLVDESTDTSALENYKDLIQVQNNQNEWQPRRVNEISCDHRCKCCGQKFGEDKIKDDKNSISITIPENLLRITLETSNNLESSITVIEDKEPQENKVYRDSQSQTDVQKMKPHFKYYNFFNRFPSRSYASNFTFSKSKSRQDSNDNLLSSIERLSFLSENSPSDHTKERNKFETSLNNSAKQYSSVYPKYYVAKYRNESVKKVIPDYKDILLSERKYEESVDFVCDMITEEFKINVSKKRSESKRFNSLHNSNIFFNTYPMDNTSLRPCYNFKK